MEVLTVFVDKPVTLQNVIKAFDETYPDIGTAEWAFMDKETIEEVKKLDGGSYSENPLTGFLTIRGCKMIPV